MFSDIIKKIVSRRDFIKSGALVFGMGSFASLTESVPLVFGNEIISTENLLGFMPVKANSDDTLTLPKGYSYEVLISWGDPLFSKAAPFDHVTRGNSKSQALAFGDNNDGMEIFQFNNNSAIIAVNNEYTNLEWILPSGKVKSIEDAMKTKNAHGISIFEIRKEEGIWKIVLDSKYNRRITPDSDMQIVGYARGSDFMKTSEDSDGTRSKGTWNNCGSGKTPWGTYLTCEEDFHEYFASTDESMILTEEYKRYGIGKKDSGYGWYKLDDRFDLSKEPNEPNRVGYVVEIDPLDPKSIPRKLTSLGRFKHENAECVVNKNGYVVVYMGDDEKGEYLYKFVTDRKYKPHDHVNNINLLNTGTLYVAKFGEADNRLSGNGRWIALTYGLNGLTEKNGFKTQADVQIFARNAATFVGATTMDRPEWVAAHPENSSVFCCLTNNNERGKKNNKGGVEQNINGPNPRKKNNYGQILRWVPNNCDHTDEYFSWNLFVLAGHPMNKDGLYQGSENINTKNMFNSPDGLSFDTSGRMWIQTDGKYSNESDYAGMGNNQMLCADTKTGEIRRFLVGPVACEITGTAFTSDGKSMFVGIQHPGEYKQASHFPDGDQSIPRSSVVVITKDDGGTIGT